MKSQTLCLSGKVCLDKQCPQGFHGRLLRMAMLASIPYGQKDDSWQKGGRLCRNEMVTKYGKNALWLCRRNYVNCMTATGASEQETYDETLASSLQDIGATVNSLISESIGEDVWDEDDENEELHSFKGLVLDLTYRPINVVSWKRALCLDILEKAEVLEYYDHVVCSPNQVFFIPAVLKMSHLLHRRRLRKVKLSLTRYNIFLRDKFKCQYCHGTANLTVDHIIPVSRGGGRTWDNLVTACSNCNLKKGDKTLDELQLKLRRPPTEPRELDCSNMPLDYRTFRALICLKKVPPEWVDYMPKRSSKV